MERRKHNSIFLSMISQIKINYQPGIINILI